VTWTPVWVGKREAFVQQGRKVRVAKEDKVVDEIK